MKKRKRLADIPHPEPVSLAEAPESVQENLLTLLAVDTERALKIRSRVLVTYWEGAYGKIARAIYSYLDEHKKAPGLVHLVDLFPNAKDQESKRLKKVFRMIKRMHEHPSFNADFVMSQLDDFINHQTIKTATRELIGGVQSSSLIDATKVVELRGIMQDALDKTSKSYGGRLLSNITPRNPQFLWWPYLVAGEINIIGGKGHIGKGVMLTDIAARIAKGQAWPDKSGRAPKGRVLWAETEDSFETTIAPRFIGHEVVGKAMKNVLLFNRDEFLQLDLRSFIQENSVKLVVLSPLNPLLQKIKNTNDEMAVRNALIRLHDAVQDTDCAIAAIMHLNKKTDLDAVERLLGSGAYANFSRSILLLNQDEMYKGWRRLVHAKHNLSEEGRNLLFEINNSDSERSQYLYTTWHQVPDGQNADADTFLDRQRSRSNAQKLSDKGKLEIEARWETGEKASVIASDFPVSKRWINELAKKEGWVRGE